MGRLRQRRSVPNSGRANVAQAPEATPDDDSSEARLGCGVVWYGAGDEKEDEPSPVYIEPSPRVGTRAPCEPRLPQYIQLLYLSTVVFAGGVL